MTDVMTWPFSIKVLVEEGMLAFQAALEDLRSKHPKHRLRVNVRRTELSRASTCIEIEPNDTRQIEEIWEDIQ